MLPPDGTLHVADRVARWLGFEGWEDPDAGELRFSLGFELGLIAGALAAAGFLTLLLTVILLLEAL